MKNLFKAIANLQNEVPVILKDTDGYGYKYADLPAILGIINPLLKKHGLGFTQPIEGTSIKTILFHIESGESLEFSTDIPQGVQLKGMNDFQVLGSAITYIRRYALSSALGLVTDKDNDASGEQTSPKAAKKDYPEDNRPWMTEAQFGKVKERIVGGDKAAFEAAIKAFKMKKEYRKVLESMVNEL